MTKYPWFIYSLALTCIEYWLLLDNSMGYIGMCEMLRNIYEVAVTAILIVNMQERVFNTYGRMENNARIVN